MQKQPTLFQALLPIFLLVFLLFLNVSFFEDTLSGPNQMALIFSATVAGLIAIYLSQSWENILDSVVKSINSAMPSMLILLLIGALAGTWLISGVVPTMIYYGLKILNPKIFLFATVIICALVSLATGSSWSTVATIGIALLGIGKTLGIHDGVIAGAIISGAYFGDKISPLSDTTNLAPAMAGTDLFTHIRYMLITTVPTLLITLVIFLFIGFNYDFGNSDTNVNVVLDSIENTFYISPVLLLVPVLLVVVIIRKVPPIPALLFGIVLGGVFAVIFQPDVLNSLSGYHSDYAYSSYTVVMKSMFGPVTVESGNAMITDLFSTGGMQGMLNTIWLILAAMIFGGAMESAGLLVKITQSLLRFAKSTGSLVATTAGSCLFLNVTASDQYISIVVPGKMFAETYKKKGYKPELLSRTLEDSGTVTSVLIPWNTCGATQSKVLGVDVLTYLPYAFFNIISPLMTILVAYLGIKIRRIKD
ncbi:MAG: Na+/H+ antiporter NhaC [Bacteroidales bacterium]|nr:Na+/H+ antiporter NhaC [Bacteroidales bacterium]